MKGGSKDFVKFFLDFLSNISHILPQGFILSLSIYATSNCQLSQDLHIQKPGGFSWILFDIIFSIFRKKNVFIRNCWQPSTRTLDLPLAWPVQHLSDSVLGKFVKIPRTMYLAGKNVEWLVFSIIVSGRVNGNVFINIFARLSQGLTQPSWANMEL